MDQLAAGKRSLGGKPTLSKNDGEAMSADNFTAPERLALASMIANEVAAEPDLPRRRKRAGSFSDCSVAMPAAPSDRGDAGITSRTAEGVPFRAVRYSMTPSRARRDCGSVSQIYDEVAPVRLLHRYICVLGCSVDTK